MCPPGPSASLDIGTYWTDEDLIMSLDRIQHGSPLPSNVVADVNPFEYKPSNLPGDVWFFVCPDIQKETEIGFWKSNGDRCQIYSDSKLTGWRTTLEFYEGQSNDEHKTEWVMQKYWITQKGTNSLQASGSLYRVFSCDGECRKQKRQRHGSPFLEERNICEQCGPTKTNQVSVGHDEESPDFADIQDDIDCFSRGDYLELLDLENPRSSSSSSDNSSCLSMASSDDVFDYLALLNDLEPEHHKEIQSKSTSCNLNVMTSSVPNDEVVRPAANGTVLTNDGSQSSEKPLEEEHPLSGPPLERVLDSEDATKLAGGNGEAELPNSDEASTSQRSVPDKGKKITLGKMKMLRKKYLCFMPF